MRTLVLLILCLGCTGQIGDGPTDKNPFDIDPELTKRTADDDKIADENEVLFAKIKEFFPYTVDGHGPKRMFRLTRQQLDNTTRALLGDLVSDNVTTVVPTDPLQTNYEYAENLRIDATNFRPYVDWVDEIAERVEATPRSVIDCDASDSACIDDQATLFLNKAFRNVAPDEAIQSHVAFYKNNIETLGYAKGTAELVSASLTSSHYLFRKEVTVNDEEVLSPEESLQHLSYTLSDMPPFAVLGDEEGDEAVAKVLATEQAREKLLRFFISWLEIKGADKMDPSDEVFPEFTEEVAAAVVEETNSFLRAQLSGSSPSLGNVLYSTTSDVADEMAFIYGRDSGGMGVEHDPTQRMGVLTQPGFIISHSGPVHTRLVKRGVFFTRKVMCQELGHPPENADTTLPEIENATERERVEFATDSPDCAGCHRFINPFGFSLESYDPIGRFRTEDEQGRTIDPSVNMDLLDKPLRTETSVEALRGFTESTQFQQCFARQLFRFYMGRDEIHQDHPILRQMVFRFIQDGEGDIVALLRQLAESQHFTQRSEPEEM